MNLMTILIVYFFERKKTRNLNLGKSLSVHFSCSSRNACAAGLLFYVRLRIERLSLAAAAALEEEEVERTMSSSMAKNSRRKSELKAMHRGHVRAKLMA